MRATPHHNYSAERCGNSSAERCRRVPFLVAVLYAAFVPATLFCALHWSLFILTWVLGICIFVLSGLVWVVERQSATSHWKDQAICGLCRDATQFVRLAFTILFPMFLVFFEGTSCLVGVVLEKLSKGADPCSVRQLSHLEATAYMRFACADGFIAVDLQMGVPAWSGPVSQSEQQQAISGWFSHRLVHTIHRHEDEDSGGGGGGSSVGSLSSSGAASSNDGQNWFPTEAPPKMRSPAVVEAEAATVSSHTVGKSEGNRFGFVAPVYVSFEDFEAGEGPVAWAVKAGQPVRRSHCPDDTGIHRTCGMFALRLQKQWASLPRTPDWFGRRWGFNITHFSYEQMLHAREELINRYPDLNLTGLSKPTFVVAEDVQQYFGRSYSVLWVVISLLMLGFMDRIVSMFSARSWTDYTQVNGVEPEDMEEDFPTRRPFNDACVQDKPDLLAVKHATVLREATPPEPVPSLIEEARQFWMDALGTAPPDPGCLGMDMVPCSNNDEECRPETCRVLYCCAATGGATRQTPITTRTMGRWASSVEQPMRPMPPL